MTGHEGDGRVRWAQSLRQGRGDLDPAEVVGRLDTMIVAVVIGTGDAPALAAQITALTTVNLLARLFRRLVIVVPADCVADPRLPFAAGPLGEALAAFARRVHPDVHVTLEPEIPEGACTLRIAANPTASDQADVYCWGAGWLARVSRDPFSAPTDGDDTNPIGPLIAAALGAAEVFKVVFGDCLPDAAPAEDVRFSALTYAPDACEIGPPLGDVALPDTVLAGAGSIGSAFLWGLAHLRSARGHLAIVDPDSLAAHNPDRAILALDDAALRGLPKAGWARDVVAPQVPHLDIDAHECTIREYIDTLPPEYTLPLAVSAVDSVEGRRDIQDALPQRIVNASTGPSRVEVSRHEGFGGDGPCLYCLYLPELLERAPIRLWAARTGFDDPKDIAEMMMPENGRRLTAGNVRGVERHNGLEPGTLSRYEGRPLPELLADDRWYSQALVPTADGQALITTAFVSALAGFLLLAEAVKEAVPALAPHRLRRIYEQGLLGVPNGFVQLGERDKTGYCLCHSPFRRDLYRRKYGDIASP